MNDIVISASRFDSPEYGQVWQLREEVLRKPLGLSLKNEDLGMDAEDTLFTAQQEGKVIGCLMLHPVSTSTIKLRQMAIDPNWQRRNIGRQLVSAAEKFAAENGYTTVVLHARRVAEGFYKALGYAAYGAVFTEVGIDHVAMSKQL